MSEDITNNVMPVFRPLKVRPMLAGIGIPEFFIILLVLACGIGSFFMLGTWTHRVNVPITQAEALVKLSEYQSLQGTVSHVEQLFDTTGAQTLSDIDLSASDAQDYRRAVELGIGADTSRDDLLKLIPDTVEHTQPIINDILRGIIFIALPFFIAVGLLIEYSRAQSVLKDLRRLVKNARKQHVFITRPKIYLKEAL